jgi:hypothetical protein
MQETSSCLFQDKVSTLTENYHGGFLGANLTFLDTKYLTNRKEQN